MKNIFELFFVLALAAVMLIAAIAYLLKGAGLKRVARNFSALVAVLFAMPMEFRLRTRYGGERPYFANAAEVGAGTHEDVTTKFSAVAITQRHLLFKFDTTDATRKNIIVCGAGDRAIFAVADEVSTLILGDVSPAPIEARILGTSHDSIRMVANNALTAGTVVYPAAGGTVDSYTNLGAGTYFPCGVVLVGSTAAGQIIEVAAMLSAVASTQ